jgi:hypothetical protein
MYILPYPQQLPQDYYDKNLPPVVPVTPEAEAPPVITSPAPPTGTLSYGGVFYGSTPPDSPNYGWLWTNTQGALYVYMEPGVWSQIGTNW